MNEENRTFAEKFSDATKKAVSVAPLVAALLIALWWVFFGAVKITNLELGIVEKVGLTVITIAMAISYRKLISTGGFDDAKKTDDYKNTEKQWKDTKKVANSHRSEIREFTKDFCYNNLKEVRTKNLENNGLTYNEIFDPLGHLIAIDFKKNKYNKKKNPDGFKWYQRRIIKKCCKLRVYIPDVFGLDSSHYIGLKKRQDEKTYKAKNNVTQLVTTSLLAFFSTSIMITWIGFSKGSWVQAVLQIGLWTATGVLQRISNYNFVLKKTLPQIEDNISIIDEYMSLPEDRKQHYVNIIREKEESKFIKMLVNKTKTELKQDLMHQQLISQ